MNLAHSAEKEAEPVQVMVAALLSENAGVFLDLTLVIQMTHKQSIVTCLLSAEE